MDDCSGWVAGAVKGKTPTYEGMPLIAWDDNNFATIASRYGRVLANIDPIDTCLDLSCGTVCILTASRSRISEEIPVAGLSIHPGGV
ncbi:hypothetical protein L2E82_39289 [Cichorium intybus]|uniref:Uncharacterized protein n=1 Tax=Cichorium intybus TaxID=13427 RepID=A0ACB9AI34_CICIN|nr:hypothetical protein L2E82_39289 [Cichorium intybus]